MKDLLIDVCVDRKHTAHAFLALAPGAFITDWIAADALDTDILALARQLDRILLTEDADFGDLIFRDLMAPPPGVVLAMAPLIPRADRAARLAALAAPALAVADGHFVVVSPTRNRFRPFPNTAMP